MADTKAVIFGATSALGQSVARLLVADQEHLILVARDAQKLAIVADDLTARGGSVTTRQVDLDDMTAHTELVDGVSDADSFWFFYGTLPDQAACERDWQATASALQTNFLSAASLLTRIGSICQARGSGSIVVISSVAGDRGRKSNYVYGTAKGALSLFCQGLRNRLSESGVHVLTVKPGFIDTPMTADIEIAQSRNDYSNGCLCENATTDNASNNVRQPTYALLCVWEPKRSISYARLRHGQHLDSHE